MEGMREEIAREFGLSGAYSTEFADLSSKLCGAFGQKLWSRARGILNQTQGLQKTDNPNLADASKKRTKKRPN